MTNVGKIQLLGDALFLLQIYSESLVAPEWGVIPDDLAGIISDCQGNLRTDFCDLEGNLVLEAS